MARIQLVCVFVVVVVLAGIQIYLSINSLLRIFPTAPGLWINTDKGVITIGDYYSPGTSGSLVRFAPYQDFVYRQNERISLKATFSQIENGSDIVQYLYKLWQPNQWNWSIDSPSGSYQYNITPDNNGFILHRKFISNDSEVDGLGQSIFYCANCLVQILSNPQRVEIDNQMTGHSVTVGLQERETVTLDRTFRIVEIINRNDQPARVFETEEEIQVR